MQGGQEEGGQRNISASDDHYTASLDSQQGLRSRVSNAAAGMVETSAGGLEESGMAYAGEKAD